MMLLLFAVSSCKTRYITTEVPIELHDTITAIKTVHSVDTIERVERIHIFDTMYIDTSTIATLGMPVLRHERATLIANSTKQRHSDDSTNVVERVVERPVAVTQREVVEVNVLRWWQTALMWAGALAIVALVCLWLWKK